LKLCIGQVAACNMLTHFPAVACVFSSNQFFFGQNNGWRKRAQKLSPEVGSPTGNAEWCKMAGKLRDKRQFAARLIARRTQ